MSDKVEVDAIIEITAQDGGFLKADLMVTDDAENPACIFARWLGTNIQELNVIAQREHKTRKALEPAKSEIISGPRKLVGPDGGALQ